MLYLTLTGWLQCSTKLITTTVVNVTSVADPMRLIWPWPLIWSSSVCAPFCCISDNASAHFFCFSRVLRSFSARICQRRQQKKVNVLPASKCGQRALEDGHVPQTVMSKLYSTSPQTGLLDSGEG